MGLIAAPSADDGDGLGVDETSTRNDETGGEGGGGATGVMAAAALQIGIPPTLPTTKDEVLPGRPALQGQSKRQVDGVKKPLLDSPSTRNRPIRNMAR